jgi:hypothetical protein
MLTIGFYENQLSERGTSIALYDYAYYNQTLLNNKSIIFYEVDSKNNNNEVIKKFASTFDKIYPVKHYSEIDDIVLKEKIDIMYFIKSGENDNKLSTKCKNVVHCVFTCSEPHGDVYAPISFNLKNNNNRFPEVPHIINLPETKETLHSELKIPINATVFGRHGAFEYFNNKYVQEAVYEVAKDNPNIYFIFLNTEQFCVYLPNIIHLDKIIDLKEKVKFINTCDAMLWASTYGETFGLSIAEFSSKNKPVITTKADYNPNSLLYQNIHLDLLKDKALIYHNKKDVMNYLLNIKNIIKLKSDWNAYKDYTPEKVMQTFKKVFIDKKESIIHSNVFPINFCIPKSIISKYINPNKKYIFAPLVPGKLDTYIYNKESEYYKQYNESFYAITFEKAGIDCMRHYEILANGCIPYFPNLENCSKNTMFKFPKDLILEAMKLPGVTYENINFAIFPINKYLELANKLLLYTQEHLTTISIANYVISKMEVTYPRILFLSGETTPDYMRCLLLHGLKSILGTDVVDEPSIDHLYDDYPEEKVKDLYGKGFSYNKRLNKELKTKFDFNDMKNFDYVIYGSIHRKLPHWDLVNKLYSKDKIFLVCGEDKKNHNPCCMIEKYKDYKLFVRELDD